MTARDDLREAAERIAVGTAMSYDQARAMLDRALKAENNVLPTRRNPARDDLTDSILRAYGYVKMPSRGDVYRVFVDFDGLPPHPGLVDDLLALLAGETS